MKITSSDLLACLPFMLNLHHNHYLPPFKSLNSGFHASENPLCFLYHINDSHPLGLVLVKPFFKFAKHFFLKFQVLAFLNLCLRLQLGW